LSTRASRGSVFLSRLREVCSRVFYYSLCGCDADCQGLRLGVGGLTLGRGGRVPTLHHRWGR
jgi:hypothetical protein